MQKTLDKLLPKWVYYVLLAIAVLYANYFYNMSVIYDTIKRFGLDSPRTYVPYIACILMAAVQVTIFELIARIYYNYILTGTSYKGLTCSKDQFTDILRVFFIFKSLALGSASLMVYFVPYIIPLAVNIFNLVFSIIFYYLFFLYVKNKYVNKELAGKTFMRFVLPFLIYSVVILVVNLLL